MVLGLILYGIIGSSVNCIIQKKIRQNEIRNLMKTLHSKLINEITVHNIILSNDGLAILFNLVNTSVNFHCSINSTKQCFNLTMIDDHNNINRNYEFKLISQILQFIKEI